MIYTARRANQYLPADVSWIHGTALGVASSAGGDDWLYRGTLRDLDIEPGHHTYWAPEVISHSDRFHMFVSVIKGVPTRWAGHDRTIRHYTSDNLWEWKYESTLDLSSSSVIDACVYPLPTGGWRLWYKDEADGAHTWAADSPDLYNWRVIGPVFSASPHEGPNVFELGGAYWMLVDEWNGQRVLRSDDLNSWSDRGQILNTSGQRADDAGVGLHGDVVVREGDDAVIFYFTHPEWVDREREPLTIGERRTSIQAAVIHTDGENLFCDRDRELPLDLLRGAVR